jgi:uridine phosphorylase
MQPIAASELIINNRGAIYHVNCRPEEIAHTILTVGDPDRVQEISKHFDTVEFTNQHREFITHTGTLGGKRLTVISTGIGPDNIDIVVNELDALVNIDFETRLIKNELTSLNIIRLGTSGSLQMDIPVDSFVASTHGLGIDNLLNFYRHDNNEEERQLIQAFLTQTQLQNTFSLPYISTAGASLLKHFTNGFHQGITVTCPGFYGPQGRVLRIRITNFEMETSAIYGMGRILGHQCLSLSAIVANRISKEFSKDGGKAVENLITTALQIIVDNVA